MPDLGPHAVFIIAAYLGVFVVTVALIAVVIASGRVHKRRLSALEAQRPGERRR